jgi:hypothetical protein
LTSFFSFPKGEPDIRLVYNGTQIGLNECLWAPWLKLPTIEQHLWAVEPGTYMADIDLGEQYLNFALHEKTQKYGVNLTRYVPEELSRNTTRVIWE